MTSQPQQLSQTTIVNNQQLPSSQPAQSPSSQATGPDNNQQQKRSTKAAQSYARRQRQQVKVALLLILKKSLLAQEPVTLSSLARILHQHFKEKQGVPLSQKISEGEFVWMLNTMISAGDVLQIKQCLSVPYSAISESDILKIRAEAASAANNGIVSTTSSSNKSARCSKGDVSNGHESNKTKNSTSKGAQGKNGANSSNGNAKVKTLKSKKPNGIQKRPVGRPPSGKATPSRVWVNYATEFKAKTTPTTVLSPTKIQLGFR